MDQRSFYAGLVAGGSLALTLSLVAVKGEWWSRLTSARPVSVKGEWWSRLKDMVGHLRPRTPSVKGETTTGQRGEDVPDNANEECPGLLSEQAGNAASCAGCPNQKVCQSGEAKKVDPGALEVKQKLSQVKNIILVLSGKGGVGKSTVSAQVAFAMARQGLDVGLLDVDICGPSIPQMLGVKGSDVHMSAEGWSPVYVEERLCVMSIGFMLPDQDNPIIWRGPRKNGLIKQFLTDVIWGPLDALIIDTPPGTSDEHLSIVTYLNEAGIAGAIIVTTPQEVALADVRKEINFCKKTEIPILGVVENMSGFVCSYCETVSHIFSGEKSGGADQMCKDMEVPFLGRIPLNPLVGLAGEGGVRVEGASATAMDNLASAVWKPLKK